MVPKPFGASNKVYYELTKKGKDFCMKNCKDITKSSFVSNGNSTRHNGELANYVSSNLSKHEIENMVCERELKGLRFNGSNLLLSSNQIDNYNIYLRMRYALKEKGFREYPKVCVNLQTDVR